MTPDNICEAFHRFIKSGRIGGKFCYHIGILAIDRVKPVRVEGEIVYRPVQPFDQIGKMALYAYNDGKVMLFQEKRVEGGYNYWAVKRRTKR